MVESDGIEKGRRGDYTAVEGNGGEWSGKRTNIVKGMEGWRKE